MDGGEEWWCGGGGGELVESYGGDEEGGWDDGVLRLRAGVSVEGEKGGQGS